MPPFEARRSPGLSHDLSSVTDDLLLPATHPLSLAVIQKLRTLVWVSLGIHLVPQYVVPRMQEKAAARDGSVTGPTNEDEKADRQCG